MVIVLICGLWLLGATATAVVFGRAMENGGPFRIEDELVRFLELSPR